MQEADKNPLLFSHGRFFPNILSCGSYNPLFLQGEVLVLTVGSRVDRKIVNDGDKSISWSPMVIRTRPPVRRNSRFNTGLRIGS